MTRLIALLALPLLLLLGCAARQQDCSEYYSEEEFERGILIAYDYGLATGLDSCPPCPDVQGKIEKLTDEIRALYR